MEGSPEIFIADKSRFGINMVPKKTRRGQGKNGAKITCPQRQAFLMHRWGAKKRGIDFCFSYKSWLKWWKQQLGDDWFEKRGRENDQYVMARNGDKGPYDAWNVKCILSGENTIEAFKGHRLGKAKLTKAQVEDIYLSEAPIYALAERYGVREGAIYQIKRKLTWTHITDLLD